MRIKEYEKKIEDKKEFGPVGCKWAFWTLSAMYKEGKGHVESRLMGKFRNILYRLGGIR